MNDFTTSVYVGIKEEDDGGVYQTPVAPIGYPINDISMVSPELNLAEYGRPSTGKPNRGRYVAGAQSATFDFTSFMLEATAIIAGPVYTVPPAELFISAGYYFDEATGALTHDGASNCTSFSMDHITLGCLPSGATTATGDTYEMRGVKTNVVISAEAVGAPIVTTFSAMAAIEAHNRDGEAILDAPTYETIALDRFLGAAVTLGGSELNVESFSIDNGNTVVVETSAAFPNGSKTARITDNDKKVTITAKTDTATAALWASATEGTVINELVITGLLYDYTYDNLTISSWGEADASGIKVVTLELSCSDATIQTKAIPV
jgi:hypothetical protein